MSQTVNLVLKLVTRKAMLIFLATILLSVSASAQKFGYVNTDYILSKMPEYKEAQGEIDKLAIAWEEEISGMLKEIDAMYSALQAEEVLLTKEMKEQRLDLIKKKEVEVKDYQKKVFGYEGQFFLKKQELIKPVVDKVYDAVGEMAREHRLQIVFDKAGGLTMIYTDPIHDYTDYVLEHLGLGDPNDTIK